MKESPFGPAGKVTGTDACEWFPVGFLLNCARGAGPLGDMKSLGFSATTPTTRSTRTTESTAWGMSDSAKGMRKGDTWTYTSSSKMNGKVIKGRYVMKEISPTSYSFSWSIADDKGGWKTVMEGKETKARYAGSAREVEASGLSPTPRSTGHRRRLLRRLELREVLEHVLAVRRRVHLHVDLPHRLRPGR